MYRARHSACPSHGCPPRKPRSEDRRWRTDDISDVQIRELSADIRPPSSDQATTLHRKSSTSVRSSETAASTACEPSSTAPAGVGRCFVDLPKPGANDVRLLRSIGHV